MIDENNRVSLEITQGGTTSVYKGWKTVKISHGIDQLSGTFSLEVADIPEAARIQAGDACTVKIGSDVMITGYVDIVAHKATSSSSAYNAQGRDKAGDLVDCSAPAKEWGNQKFEAIAAELLKPYGMALFTQLDSDASGYKLTGKKSKKAKAKAPALKGGATIPKKATNTGETVHKLLEKMAKQQGALLVSDRTGGLIITRAGLGGASYDTLTWGKNLLSFDYEHSAANTFSEITIKGQGGGADAGRLSLATVGERVMPKATVKAAPSARIAGASARHRPLIMQAEDQADAERCKRRAEWEVGTREAKSKKVQCKVQGWRQSNGDLWAINTTAQVISPFTDIASEWIIANITYSLDQSGTITDMMLYSPAAFDVLPEIPPKETGAGNGGGRLNLATVKPR